MLFTNVINKQANFTSYTLSGRHLRTAYIQMIWNSLISLIVACKQIPTRGMLNTVYLIIGRMSVKEAKEHPWMKKKYELKLPITVT